MYADVAMNAQGVRQGLTIERGRAKVGRERQGFWEAHRAQRIKLQFERVGSSLKRSKRI